MLSSNTSLSRRLARPLALAAAVLGASLALAAPAGAAEGFVIGDENAGVGSHVEFWGAQWHKLNGLTGGPAPAAFKGFANAVTLEGKCGGSWTTYPGNSSDPPEGPLPLVIEAIVSTKITKSGRVISGDLAGVVLIATEPGYGPNPGHAGTGTVIGEKCGPGVKEEEEEEEHITT